MRKSLRTVFFTTALAPAVVLMAIKHMVSSGGPSLEAVCWLVAGLIACVLPYLIVRAVAAKAEVMPVQIKKIEPLEWPLFLAVAGYLIPAAMLVSFDDLAKVVLCAAVLLSVLDALPFHPILHLFRFRSYKIELSSGVICWLVARGRVLDPAKIKHVREIAPGLLMEEKT